MRIVINIDPIHEGCRRMRIRTKYQLDTKDGRQHLQVRNALVEFYQTLIGFIREGADARYTDVRDEGEKL